MISKQRKICYGSDDSMRDWTKHSEGQEPTWSSGDGAWRACSPWDAIRCEWNENTLLMSLNISYRECNILTLLCLWCPASKVVIVISAWPLRCVNREIGIIWIRIMYQSPEIIISIQAIAYAGGSGQPLGIWTSNLGCLLRWRGSAFIYNIFWSSR